MKRVLSLVSLLLVLVMCVFMFASCGMNSYEKRLEKAGYEVEVADKDELEEINEEAEDYKIKGMLVATKGLNTVTITKFGSSKQAKEQAEDAQDYADSIPGFTVEIKGKYVIAGTEDAVKAALGK